MTNPAVDQEPAPEGGKGPSIHDLVVMDVYQRKRFGRAKYGTVLQAGDGRRSLVDAYQEGLDLVVYLRKALAEAGADPSPRRRWSTNHVVLMVAAIAPLLAVAMVGVAKLLEYLLGSP